MALSEEMAYLEGYIEGLDISEDTKEGKAIFAILELLGKIVEDSVEIREEVEDLSILGEELDEDLGELEEFVFEDGCGCGCGCEDEEDMYDEYDDDYDLGGVIYDDDEDEEEEA